MKRNLLVLALCVGLAPVGYLAFRVSGLLIVWNFDREVASVVAKSSDTTKILFDAGVAFVGLTDFEGTMIARRKDGRCDYRYITPHMTHVFTARGAAVCQPTKA